MKRDIWAKQVEGRDDLAHGVGWGFLDHFEFMVDEQGQAAVKPWVYISILNQDNWWRKP